MGKVYAMVGFGLVYVKVYLSTKYVTAKWGGANSCVDQYGTLQTNRGYKKTNF